jgi:magnesium transporter
MDVRFLVADRIERHQQEEIPVLLKRDDGILWVDIPECDAEAAGVLSEVFGFHPLAVRDCVQRNYVPKVRAYRDHIFVVLHVPERGAGGHVHYVELDQFVGTNYVVTVHGPVNSRVGGEVAVRETRAVLRRAEAGRFAPASSFELSYAIVSAVAQRQEAFVAAVTQEVWPLEQRVTAGHMGDPVQFLEELFRTRHALLAVRNMADLGAQIYGRMAVLARFLPGGAAPLVADIVDQLERVRALADGQKEYLQGVIEYYQTRSTTKVAIAAERLALIAVITLPITALSSLYGMNLIVHDSTQVGQLLVVLAVMIVITVLLLRWAKKQGWW